MKKTLVLIIYFIGFCSQLLGQVYTEKQSRHRFAQLNFGLDAKMTLGGSTTAFSFDQTRFNQDFNSFVYPRLVFGGTHFWGHADFYIAISLYQPTQEFDQLSLRYTTTVETAFKYYPWRIEHKKIRPYIGIMLAPLSFQQSNLWPPGEGPSININSWPLMAGFTFNLKNQLIELGASWNYQAATDYHISSTDVARIQLPPVALNISYRIMLETTLGAEKDWESGKTDQTTMQLNNLKKLNSFF